MFFSSSWINRLYIMRLLGSIYYFSLGLLFSWINRLFYSSFSIKIILFVLLDQYSVLHASSWINTLYSSRPLGSIYHIPLVIVFSWVNILFYSSSWINKLFYWSSWINRLYYSSSWINRLYSFCYLVPIYCILLVFLDQKIILLSSSWVSRSYSSRPFGSIYIVFLLSSWNKRL